MVRSPYDPWHSIRLFFKNAACPIEILSVRTIRPRKLKLRRPGGTIQRGTDPFSEAVILKNLGWTVHKGERGSFPLERYIFVNLEGQNGEVTVELELMVRLLDDRRTETPVRVRTNVLHVRPGT